MSVPRSGRLLVDGSNLMGSRPDGWWRDRPAARRRLVGELAAARRAVRAAAGLAEDGPVIVVFDGRPHDVGATGLDVRFVAHADDLLAELAGPGDVVVTSDRVLRGRVAAAGAASVGAGRVAGALAS
ncbi:NTP pyrophosphohydrolase [Patulibacter sp. S7RM1-6]